MARKARLFSICSVQLGILESKPPKLAVTVHGYAVSSGWTGPELVPLEKTLSPDGILDLDFVATPPDTVSLPVLTPATAETVWADNVDRLVGVRVVSRSGDVIELLPSPAAQTTTQPAAEETTQIAGEGPHPHWAAAGARATTMVVGEECPPPLSTMATGEETVFKTFEIGEESHPTQPRTFLEKPPQGEVFSLPEIEDPPQPPTTTAPRIEEAVVGKPPNSEVVSLPEAEGPTTTAPQWEEMVTDILAEDGPFQQATGRLTTLVVGEESVATRPWGETTPRWDNPKVPRGETSPHSDDPKPAFGETWFDPQDMNPLGRR